MKSADFDTDRFLELLTDALRAGPGSPAWHEAVSRVRLQGELAGGSEDDYKALLAAREHLESGKGYRQVRAGPGFTRKLMAAVNEDGPGGRGGPATTTVVALAAGAVGLGAIVLIASLLMSGNGPRRQSLSDLKSETFSQDILSSSFAHGLPRGWNAIGSLQGSWGSDLRPPATAPSDGYAGCGVAIQTPLPADRPAAVEVSLHLSDPNESVIPQVFVTDQPDFSADRGISPHELVWALQPQMVNKKLSVRQQVVLPDGTFATSGQALRRSHDVVTIRVSFNADFAMVDSDGQRIYAGPHQLAPDKPRYVGVRFLRRGPAKLHDMPGLISVRISQG